MNFIRRSVLIIIVFSVSISGFAQEIRKYNNDFLNIGVGARALSLGNANAASTNDVYSGFWNPAGLLSGKKHYEVALMHAEQFAGLLKYDYLGANYRIDSMSNAGFSVIRSGVDNIQNSLDLFDKDGNLDYNRITNFSVADYAFIFSYARKTKIPALNFGVNFKIIYRNEGKFADGIGFGLDAGAQYKKGKWLFGAMAKDVSTTFTFWSIHEDELKVTFETDSTVNTLPENTIDITAPALNLGVARKFSFSDKLEAVAEVDAQIYLDGERNSIVSGNTISLYPAAGMEFIYQKMLFFRLGVGDFQKIEDFYKTKTAFKPNLGIGIFFKGFSLDYAITDIGSQAVSYSNVFSLKFNFDWNK